MARALWLSFFLAAAVGCSSDPPVQDAPAKPCLANIECPSDQLCLNGFGKACSAGESCLCKPFGKCTTDAACGAGLKCLSDGSCGESQCELASDCCAPAEPNCGKQCLDYQCVGTSCAAGDTQKCFNECHQGQLNCVNGEWSACDATPFSQTEICGDGIDNNCDGATDPNPPCQQCQTGATKVCEGPCGNGQQKCDETGNWGPCDATDDCTCTPGEPIALQDCGDCGKKTGSCVDGLKRFSECLGEGECSPTTVDQPKPCGFCGTQIRTCTAECSWGPYEACTGQGECDPDGLPGTKSCGNCGSQTRECDQKCDWGVWSECVDGTGCTEGQSKSQPCGNCGEQFSTCNAQCEWSEYGACQGSGECVKGAQQTDDCGNCGEQTKTCNITTCMWGPYTSCTGAGVCAKGQLTSAACGATNVGICEYGVQDSVCNANCQWEPVGGCDGEIGPSGEICGNELDEDCNGSNLYLADSYENNDTCGSCTLLNSINDKDIDTTLTATFDSVGDSSDYFCFYADDGTSVLGPEHIKVDVTSQQGSIDADLYLYKETCGTAIASDTGANKDKKIDWSENFASNDGGLWIVRVSNFGGVDCFDTYSLKIVGLD